MQIRRGRPHTRSRSAAWAVPALAGVVLLGLSACAIESGGPGLSPDEVGDDSTDTAADTPSLDDRTFVSTSVTGHDLVAGSVVRMTFEAGQLSVQAGCNTMIGEYAVEQGTLQVASLAQTQMACAPELMAQDEWLAGFLEGGPELRGIADRIILTGGDVELELTDRVVAEPDLALAGPTWVLDTSYTDTATTNIRGMENASLVFEGGNVQLDTGCNTGGGSYTLEGDTLTLGPLRLTLMACEGTTMEIEQLMTAVLNQQDLTAEVKASTLKLTAPDGTALGFVAESGAGSDTEATTAP
ncbi:META domain-containing protein [Ornithinimicrobium sp. F0845]|uniref:META domain-containing protein n=1 Tax=Ornithinimicrobium sp. F0845 TaxID=2926412 RepID=UPI001FF5826D|nr:META domain-containing protein [Ornithinimicrobium sp. F0845]MCK0112700.1 META domain-containing protein [Ornithinimicrobium sp. F0845]